VNYRTIRYEDDERVALITLNRPERMNAMNREMCAEVMRAVRAADDDPEIRVVIITGAGDRAFSAGYDLGELEDDLLTVAEWRRELARDLAYTYTVWDCTKPVIAMIDGYCLAGALELVLMCDVRYCSDDSRFGVVETRFSSGVASLAMPWIVGARCREYIYTGDVFGAEEAFRMGLVNRVFPKADLRAECLKIAKRMSQVALAALQLHKRALNGTSEVMGFRAALQYGVEMAAVLNGTQTPEFKAFEEIRSSKGVKAATEWRNQLFARYE
jgi:enoyl-CoA hydratase/carnithine racemase